MHFRMRAPRRTELTPGQQRQLELWGWRWCPRCDTPFWAEAHVLGCRGPQPVDPEAVPWGLATPEPVRRLSPEVLALLPADLQDVYRRGWVCKWEPAELEALVLRARA